MKTKLNKSDLIRTIEKVNKNGGIIVGKSKRSLFNGIFSYNFERIDGLLEKIQENELYKNERRNHCNEIYPEIFDYCVNYIALDPKHFIMEWSNDKLDTYVYPYYSLYKFAQELTYGYFISNLLNHLRLEKISYLTEEEEQLSKFYYPLIEGKESRLVGDYNFETSSVNYNMVGNR